MKITRFKFLLLPLLLGVSATATANNDDALKSQLDIHKDLSIDNNPKAYRVLFIGASIMLHGVGDWTLKMGWDHEAGMAASSAEKDYVHLFSGMIQKQLKDRKVEVYYHNYGGNGSAADRLAALDKVVPVKPHLVVVQLGGHEKSIDDFRTNLHKLFLSVAAMDSAPQIICTGTWNPDGNGKYTAYRDGSAQADQMIQEECKALNISFVSVQKYALEPKCTGWGTHPGVQWHPNDNGHRGYADELFKAFLSMNSKTLPGKD